MIMNDILKVCEEIVGWVVGINPKPKCNTKKRTKMKG
jgi:hypothetical protein